MSLALIPSSKFRPQTAMQGETDARDEIVFSSIVVAGGASGFGKMFTVPQGQAIPELYASGTYTATAQAHQKTHSELTTNLEKAGEFGSGLGDAAVRGISLTLECAAMSSTASTGYNAYGAQPLDVAEFLAKAFFQFKVGQKVMTQGPVYTFPSWGGPQGTLATTGNNSTVGMLNNGNALLGGRRIRIPIQISRVDVVVGVLGFGNSSSFTGSAGATYGSPFLVWCILSTLLGADVR